MKISKPSIISIASIIFVISLITFHQQIIDTFYKKNTRLKVKSSSVYNISHTYNLPGILDEISGLAWLNNNTFACVQDEDGIIFIYDTNQNTIINEIKFAGSGDYEAIAINNSDAYVLRSDGLIYEIKNYESKSRKISKIETPFNEDNNMESLTFDKQNNRLLIAPKDKDLGKKHIKSIYQIPMLTKIMDSVPLVEIDLKSEALKDFQQKKTINTLRPSDIAIHPNTRDIYVLEGVNPKLLIFNKKGKFLKVHPLDQLTFAQPEGITFNNEGNLFISNEATNNWANILEVHINLSST